MHLANMNLKLILLAIHNLPFKVDKEKNIKFKKTNFLFKPQLIEVENLERYIHIQNVHQLNIH